MKNKRVKSVSKNNMRAVRKQLAKNFKALCAGSVVLACSSQPMFAQTVTPSANDTITNGTSIQGGTGNGITIPSTAPGVTINNGVGGQITSSAASAIATSADTAITNSGSITGGFNGVNFVNGAGSGSLDNTASGTISSDSRAVNIGGSVQLTNAGQIQGTGDQRNGTVYSDSVANNFSIDNSGTIDAGAGNQGSGVGLEIGPQTTADITNSGLIQGRTNTPGVAGNSGLSGDGLRLANFGASGVFDGTIENTASGEIRSESQSGTIAGLRVADGIGFQGTLDNDGTIEGPQNGLYFGNGDHTGGVANNNGTISSDSRALNIDGEGLTVNNTGDILGTGNQRNGTVYADGTADNFTLNNSSSGVIDAGAGNTGSGVGAEIGGAADGANTFALTNNGTIQGRGNASSATSAAGDGVRIGNVGNSGVAEVSATNTGTISSEGANGTVAGVRVVDNVGFSGTLDNLGSITGTQNGVYFGEGDHSDGVVNNSGTISSDSRALNIDGDGLTVNNAGDILGTGNQRNGTVYADGTADNFAFNNSSTGVVDAGAGNTGSGVGAEIGGAADGANTFSLTNNGTIQGRGNASSATSAAGDGVRIGNAGNSGVAEVTALNTGTISSEGANGTVAGVRVVDNVGFSGTLDNLGSITGTQNGVYFGLGDHSDGVVNNAGTISSDSRALNIDGDGLTINNAGDIVGTGNQRNGTVYADGTADNFTLNNSTSGTIDAGAGNTGSGFGVEIGGALDGANTFSLTNDGTIQGRGNASAATGAAGDGVRIGNVGNSGVAEVSAINRGSISSEGANGTVAGVRFVDNVGFSGTFDNSGSISGVQNGLYFGDADHSNGVFTNSGTISSDSRAVNIDGVGLTLNNSGDILATGSQRNGTVYVDGTADQFSISNSGSIDATGGSGSGISVEVGSFAGDIQSGLIVNSGTIVSSGAQSIDAGIRLFGGSGGVTTFSGDITNTAGGSITTAGDAAAVLFDSSVSFDGTLFNDGFIEGSVLLNDGDLVLGDDSILSLEISSLADFDTIETTGSIFADGILDITFDGAFLPAVGQQFDLLDFGFTSGSFDLVRAAGVTFDISDLGIGGSVEITAVAAAIPEPSSLAVLGLASFVMTLRRRRKVC